MTNANDRHKRQIDPQYPASQISSALPASVPQRVPTLGPAGGLVDLGVSRGEDLQGFSAVKIWEEGAGGFIVQGEGRDPAPKCFGSINRNT